MKKLLLLSIAAAMTAIDAAAIDQCFTYTGTDGFPVYGTARRVSPNGKWVCGGDENEYTGSFIIDTANPSEFTLVPECLMLDINDSGTAVGVNYRKFGDARYNNAAVYIDGQWYNLPVPEDSYEFSQAVAISNDGTIIGGHVSCPGTRKYEDDDPNDDTAHYKRFPIVWKLDAASGEYVIDRVYNDLYVPGTFGFQVTDMSPDGKWICGYHCLNMGDWVGAILNTETGELIEPNKVYFAEQKVEGTNSQTGEKVDLSGTYLMVDGVRDGWNAGVQFGGMFLYATNDYIFGGRDVVYNVKENGEGYTRICGCIYDIKNGTFIDGLTNRYYTCGENRSLQFTQLGEWVYAGSAADLNADFNINGQHLDCIFDMDKAGKVLTGCYYYFTEMGSQNDSPVVIILENGIAGIDTVTSDTEGGNIKVEGNTITVEAEGEVFIYALNGGRVTTGATATVAPGVYIVVADGVAKKVIVQ